MAKKDVRSDYLKRKNFYQEKYTRLYYGELGEFFDMLTNPAQRSMLSISTSHSITEEVLPRLRAFFERNQKNWQDSNIVFTNYFEAIAEIFSTFAIGKGVEFIFKDNEGDKFNEFWKDNKMDKVLKKTFEKTLSSGYDGGYLRVEDGKFKYQEIGFQNYYPTSTALFGYDDNDINLTWLLKKDENTYSKYLYVINFKQEENSVVITHKVYNYNEQTGIGNEVSDAVLRQFDIDGAIGEGGEQENDYKSIPIVMMENIKQDSEGFGESEFKNIVGQVQDISICETLGSMEFQEFFGSKMAIPESAVTPNKDGTPKMKHADYFIVGKNSIAPSYITRQNPDFPNLFQKTTESKIDISASTKIPVEILDKKSGANEKVELAKIRLQPFVRKVQAQRNAIDEYINGLAEIVFEGEVPEFEIVYPPIIDPDMILVKTDMREDVAAELISKKRYLQETYPELDNDAIEDILQEIKDEQGSDVKVGTNDLIGDIGNGL